MFSSIIYFKRTEKSKWSMVKGKIFNPVHTFVRNPFHHVIAKFLFPCPMWLLIFPLSSRGLGRTGDNFIVHFFADGSHSAFKLNSLVTLNDFWCSVHGHCKFQQVPELFHKSLWIRVGEDASIYWICQSQKECIYRFYLLLWWLCYSCLPNQFDFVLAQF